MNTLFVNAPFTRFDLGSHVLGQASCPAGQAPMSQNGGIVCVPFSPPNGMFVQAGSNRGVGYGAAMGQIQDPYLTQAERDRLLAEIRAAQSKLKPIEDLMAWSQDNDPQLKKYLGLDSTRFLALSNSISPIYPTAQELADRLAETDAEYWYRPSDQELAEVKQVVTGLNEMSKLIDKNKAKPYTAAPGTKPPPVLVPGVPVTSGGISTKDILIGGGVAVGLGLLIAAFA